MMDTAQFEKQLVQSKKIEDLFKKHPKFPFLNYQTSHEEFALLNLFWLYFVKSYLANLKKEQWIQISPYQKFHNLDESDDGGLTIRGLNSKIEVTVASNGLYLDQFDDYYFNVNVGISDDLVYITDDPNNQLVFMSMGVDLRHPKALDKAREFMHAFFIEKLPLEEMKKKIALFDETEGKKFQRKKNKQ